MLSLEFRTEILMVKILAFTYVTLQTVLLHFGKLGS